MSATWCWMRFMKETCNLTFCSSLWRTSWASEKTWKWSSWVPHSTQKNSQDISVCITHWETSLLFSINVPSSHPRSLVSSPLDNCPMIHIPGLTFPVQEFLLEDILEMTRLEQTRGMSTTHSTQRQINMLHHIFLKSVLYKQISEWKDWFQVSA